MQVLQVRNAHQALPAAIELLQQFGTRQMSRNGAVLKAPWPVTTEYRLPRERVVFWEARDYNPAFVAYEALWMLAGRRDVEPLTRYVKDFGRYSDDGATLHGAYGYRWRRAFGVDQLAGIARMLRENPLDRRAVLQMWDAPMDLGSPSRDVPCNDLATFQRRGDGALDMTVFCRSNDIIWGSYFANCFHFSVLQEYLAAWIGCEVGAYWQVSVNFHAYDATLAPLADLPRTAYTAPYSVPRPPDNPYAQGAVSVPVWFAPGAGGPAADEQIGWVLAEADTGFQRPETLPLSPGLRAAYLVLKAHHKWRTLAAPGRYTVAAEVLNEAPDATADLIVAMGAWLTRRAAKWEARMAAPTQEGV